MTQTNSQDRYADLTKEELLEELEHLVAERDEVIRLMLFSQTFAAEREKEIRERDRELRESMEEEMEDFLRKETKPKYVIARDEPEMIKEVEVPVKGQSLFKTLAVSGAIAAYAVLIAVLCFG